MKTIEARKHNWLDLYSKKINRVYQINIAEEAQGRPQLWPDKVQERRSFILNKYDKMLQRLEWLDDDTIPYLDMLTGTEIFAEAFGCEVHRPEEGMPCAIPFINNATEAAKVKIPELSTSSLALLFDIADKVYAEVGENAIFKLVDIQTPIDIAALMWEKTDFYVAMLTEPEAIMELCEKIKILLFSFLDEWFKRYPKEFIAHYPNYYMPYGITVSEDEVGVVSPDTFNELFLGELVEMSQRYGQIGIHCCADSEHQWGNFKKIPNLTMLNLNRPVSSYLDSVKFFKDFTALMPIIDSIQNTGENFEEQYPTDACIAMTADVDNKEEALRKLDYWQQLA